MTTKVKYDIELMRQLNKEFETKKFMTEFTEYDEGSQLKQASHRIDGLSSKINFDGKKILEIGCGRGHVAYQLVNKFDCEVIGLEVYPRPEWENLLHPKLRFMHLDMGLENPFEEEFDVILSFTVWEHIRHPRTVMQEAVKALKNGGLFYMSANLYRSAVASHLYRNIYFPFPQLLFDDEIVREFALENGVTQHNFDSFYYLNKLTYAQYKEYFSELNLHILSEQKTIRKLDIDFYDRFEDKLGLYPKHDLELDFFYVLLKKMGGTNGICTKMTKLENDTETLETLTALIQHLNKTNAKLRQENEGYRWKLKYITETWYGKLGIRLFRLLRKVKHRIKRS